MTREGAIRYGNEWLKDEYLDAKDAAFIKMAIKAFEQELCEDANVSTTDERITRYKKIEDTVKEIVKDEKCVYTNEMVYGFMKIKRILEGEEDNE